MHNYTVSETATYVCAGAALLPHAADCMTVPHALHAHVTVI